MPLGDLTNNQFVDDLNVVEMDADDHLTPPEGEDEGLEVPSEASFNFKDSLDNSNGWDSKLVQCTERTQDDQNSS